MKLGRTLFVCALAVCAAAQLQAQAFHGGVRGNVHDTTGGALASAVVMLTDENTGLEASTTTNADGEYSFANVLPGRYRIGATLSGYKPYARTGLVVGTQAFFTVDIALDLGSFADQVTVRAEAAPLDRSDGSTSALVGREMIETLPSAGRNVFFSGTITPGVIATGDSQFVRQQDQSNSSLISIGGGPRRDNAYLLDGVPITDILNRATFIPSFHAVEEMRIQTGAYDAQVGRTSGGVFNTIGRSGTNVLHAGALYETRPEWAVGRLFFAEKNDIANAPSYYHLYGGSAGGPIALNRTFFWASTEGYRSETARSTVLTLPTAAERTGDFSQSGVTIYDPLTTRPDPAHAGSFVRDPYPGNRIPANRLNPVAVAMFQYVPMPTSGKSRPAVASIVDAADQMTAKITHRWSSRATTTGMYAWYGSQEPDARFYGKGLFENAADPGEGALVRRAHTFALTTLWTVTPTAVVEARYGFNRFLDDNRPAPFDPRPLGFDPAFLAVAPQLKFPNIGVTDYGRGGSLLGDRQQSTAKYASQTASATYSALSGRHAIKAGGEFRTNGVRFLNLGGMGGYNFARDFTFGPNPSAPAPGTGDGLATFLLGFPTSGSIAVSTPIDIYMRYGSAFVQDDFRATAKLTINLGLRYEYEQGLRERDNQMAVGWAYDAPFPVQVNATRPDGTRLALTGGLRYAGVDGAPTYQGDPNPRQFGPRAGFAYAAADRIVVRGGYGLFWAPSQGISADEVGSGTPGYNRSTSYVATLGNPFIPCAGCSVTNPFPAGIPPPVGNSLGRTIGVGDSIWFVDPRSHLGHFHRYSLEIQREFPRAIVLAAGYQGMRGEDLNGGIGSGGINLNQLDPKYFALGGALEDQVPNPFAGTPLGVGLLAGPTLPRGQLLRPYPQFDTVLMTRASLARSRYNAVVVSANRRLAGRWGGQVNYTWSRLRDSQYSESNFFAGGSNLLDNYDVERDFGASVLDTPHRLNISGTVQLPLGVTVSATGTYESGFPVTINQSPNNSGLFGSGQRPNIVAGVNPVLTSDPEGSYDSACGCIRWLNPAAWSQASPFTFGNAPRADPRVRTPMRRNWDVAIDKATALGRTTVAVRAEVINVFNFADLRGPSIQFGDGSFGQIREAGGFPRMLQLSARVGW